MLAGEQGVPWSSQRGRAMVLVKPRQVVVDLIGRLNKCGVISPRFDVALGGIEQIASDLLPSRQFGHVARGRSAATSGGGGRRGAVEGGLYPKVGARDAFFQGLFGAPPLPLPHLCASRMANVETSTPR
ncbi:unnamed protein product [Prorocentrum cordatum]|uniref:Uncharacterized protein n=1 Tax=Prorocentrum cordatum TaxID=2364126 RepID=A0ABN9R7N5_9DINO|nr:unnamed protein product [Polarella glacialis]